MPHLLDKKNADMLMAHGVFSMTELKSRCEIMLDNYNKTVIIEANTMIHMTSKGIMPAIAKYTADLASAICAKKSADETVACSYETQLMRKLSMINDGIAIKVEKLEDELMAIQEMDDIEIQAYAIRDKLIPAMGELRALCDQAETKVAKTYWPYPSYADLLFSVK